MEPMKIVDGEFMEIDEDFRGFHGDRNLTVICYLPP